MNKIIALILFLCVLLSYTSHAKLNTESWCGKYFEQEGEGFLTIPNTDHFVGSKSCSIADYQKRSNHAGTAAVRLVSSRNFTSKWKKFDGHLLEIRGKYYNGQILNIRFIRDIGV